MGSSKLTYRLNAMSKKKSPQTKLIPKFTWRSKSPEVAETLLKRTSYEYKDLSYIVIMKI